MQEEPALRGFAVHWVAPGGVILSRRDELFRARGVGQAVERVGRAPAPLWRALASRIRPLQRLLRFMYYNVLELPDGRLFFTFDRTVGVQEGGVFRALPGLVRPTRVMHGGVALDERGDVYFGEYVGNKTREEVHVYRLPAGGDRLEVIHTFRPGSARHVHGVYHDPFSRYLWCVTGDLPQECRVLRTADGFRTLETVGGGDESWRTVSLVFTERSVHYGSDGEFMRNYLYRIDRATGARHRLDELDGPVYFAQSTGEDLFFGVVAELCPSQSGRSGAIWHVRDGGPGECIAAREKDALPVALFQPGTWQFSRGPGLPGSLFVHVVGLRAADNRTFWLKTL